MFNTECVKVKFNNTTVYSCVCNIVHWFILVCIHWALTMDLCCSVEKHRKWSAGLIQEVVFDIWSREKHCGCGRQPSAQADQDENSVTPDRSADKLLPEHQSASPDTRRNKYVYTTRTHSASNTLFESVKIVAWIQLSAEGKLRPGCFLCSPSCKLFVFYVC